MGCPDTDGCLGYELTADLDFDTNGSGDADAGDDYWNNGAGWTPIGGAGSALPSTLLNPFLATFEGNGQTISNLFIFIDTLKPFAGLFGYTGSDSATGAVAVVRNVKLIDVTVTGKFSLGGLVGENYGVITESYVTGLITGVDVVGGLVGQNYGVITDSHVAGCVSGDDMVGGLVGRSYGAITNGSVSGCVSGTTYVGGLTGNNYGPITASHTSGQVSGHGVVGGLVGSHKGVIMASHSTASVSGVPGAKSGSNSSVIGGLVGDHRGAITASYATGRVSGHRAVGGLVGQSRSFLVTPSAITASYATGHVSGERG